MANIGSITVQPTRREDSAGATPWLGPRSQHPHHSVVAARSTQQGAKVPGQGRPSRSGQEGHQAILLGTHKRAQD